MSVVYIHKMNRFVTPNVHSTGQGAVLLLRSDTVAILSPNALRWRHNGRDSVSNHQPHDCLLNRLFRRRSKKTSKLRVTGLWAENSPETGEFSAQMASNAENVSIWWRHHGQRSIRWKLCSHWLKSCDSVISHENYRSHLTAIFDNNDRDTIIENRGSI